MGRSYEIDGSECVANYIPHTEKSLVVEMWFRCSVSFHGQNVLLKRLIVCHKINCVKTRAGR